MAYSEEFLQNYKQPKIENIIVGFSGIDPVPIKAEREMNERIKKIERIISIDCGEIKAEIAPEKPKTEPEEQ